MPDILAIAEASLRNNLRELDTISRNTANLNTQGYKSEVYLDRGFQSYLADGVAAAAATDGETVARDLTPGPLKHTGSALSLAIEGQGYFQLDTPQGVLLTRNGQFQIDAQGRLVSGEGWPVLMKNPVTLGSADFTVLGDGTLIAAGDQRAQLDLVNAAAAALQPAGAGRYRAASTTALAAGDFHVRQGYLEQSNVDALTQMTNMMTTLRSAGATQQLLRAYDEIIDNAVSTLGEF